MNGRIVGAIGVLGVVGFLAGLVTGRATSGPASGVAAATSAEGGGEELKPKVIVSHVARSTVSPRVVCFGVARAAPGTDFVLSARVAAVVSEVVRRVGDKVQAGETILRLDARPLIAAREKAEGALAEAAAELQKGKRGALAIELAGLRVALAQARADSLQADRALTRQEELAKSGLVSDRQLQEAQANAEVNRLRMAAATQQLERAESGLQAEELGRLEARVAQARADLEGARLMESYAEVRAPIAGTISELDATPGQSVDANATLARVVAPAGIEAVLSISGEQARKVEVGADVRLIAGGVEVARATVTGVGAAVGADGTVKLRAAVPDARTVAQVAPGTPLVAEVAVGKLDALTIPRDALVQDGDRTVVVVLDQKKQKDEKGQEETVEISRKVRVKVLVRDGPIIAIEGPVEPDTVVVTEGAYNLPDGTEVDADD